MRSLGPLALLVLSSTVHADVALPSADRAGPSPHMSLDEVVCGLLLVPTHEVVNPSGDQALEEAAARVAKMRDDDRGKIAARFALADEYWTHHAHWQVVHRRALDQLERAATQPATAGAPEARARLERERDLSDVKAKEWLKRAAREYSSLLDDPDHAPRVEAALHVAVLLRELGRDADALVVLLRLLQGDAHPAEQRYVELLMAESYLAGGSLDAAPSWLARAAKTGAQRDDMAVSACTQYRSAWLAAQRGDKEAARSSLTTLVAKYGELSDSRVARIVTAAREDLKSSPTAPPPAAAP